MPPLCFHDAMISRHGSSATAGLYVITDEELRPPRTHLDIARAAIAGGASVVQLRDKRSPDEYLMRVGLEIRRATRESGVLFLVNDRVDVALRCDADGVHVGQTDRSAADIRGLFDGRVLGVSVGSLEEARRAAEAGADYIGVGPIFSTGTKSDAGDAVGLGAIAAMRDASKGLPVVAIGGINETNIADVARAGADAAAVISAIVCADDMETAARRLSEIWWGTAVRR